LSRKSAFRAVRSGPYVCVARQLDLCLSCLLEIQVRTHVRLPALWKCYVDEFSHRVNQPACPDTSLLLESESERHVIYTSGNNYPPELRERAIRMMAEVRGEYPSDWAAAQSVAAKLGIGTPQTLMNWVRKAQVDAGQRPGVTSTEAAELRRLRAEVKQLRTANEILRTASAFFAAAELDRRLG
jgi:transposase